MHFNQSRICFTDKKIRVSLLFTVQKKGLTDNRNITTSIAVDADYYIPT